MSKMIAIMMVAAGVALASPAAALERWVYVVNDGVSTVRSVQISHIDDPDWRGDLLSPHTLAPGEMVLVEPAIHNGYCRFDVRVTFVGGSEVTLWDLNLCELSHIFVDEYGLTYASY
jgi:hypothetical protein